MENEKSTQADVQATDQTSLVEELDDQQLDGVAGGDNNCPIFNVVQGCGCG